MSEMNHFRSLWRTDETSHHVPFPSLLRQGFSTTDMDAGMKFATDHLAHECFTEGSGSRDLSPSAKVYDFPSTDMDAGMKFATDYLAPRVFHRGSGSRDLSRPKFTTPKIGDQNKCPPSAPPICLVGKMACPLVCLFAAGWRAVHGFVFPIHSNVPGSDL